MITLQVEMKINPAHREEYVTAVQDLLTNTRKEEGNISYRLFTSVEDPTTFVMLEEWKDEASLKAHEKTEHFITFVQQTKGFHTAPLDIKRF